MEEGSKGGPARERQVSPEKTAEALRVDDDTGVHVSSVDADGGAGREIAVGAAAAGMLSPAQQQGSARSLWVGAEDGWSPWG